MLALVVASGVLAACVSRHAATAHTGRSARDAAPSCWAIKDAFPSSADGPYWIETGRLRAPIQVTCDMTTDGGGWVLIGRGRQGWTFTTAGQGDPSELLTTPSGPAAFTPATLSAATIDAVLQGGRVDALADGIRVRRAADTAGTTWQEVRLHVRATDHWSWALGGGLPLSSVEFDGAATIQTASTETSASTADVSVDPGARRLFTWPWSGHANQAGFAYGASVAGRPDGHSYLWAQGSEGYAVPFAQVWLRPRLDDAAAGFTAITTAGLPPVAIPAHLDSTPAPTPWGVVGVQLVADPDAQTETPVRALAQIGTRMYVGGKFAGVQHGASATPVNQSWLAAFDVATGEWDSTFRPVLDGAVFDLDTDGAGHLVVAGNFTSVNADATAAGVALLDARTGDPVPGWAATLTGRRFGGARPFARTVDVQSGWLYIGGNFTSVIGPTGTSVTSAGLARVALRTGNPDPSFVTGFDGIPWSVDASPDGHRVYVAGRFRADGWLPQIGLSVLDPRTALPIGGLGTWRPTTSDPTTQFLETVHEYGSRVVVGGSQHTMQVLATSNLAEFRSFGARYGGDFQASALLDGIVYASCHCGNWLYHDSTTVPVAGHYSRVTPMSWFAGFNPTTFTPVESFQPQLTMSSQYEGPWALTPDTAHCLWVGGDVTSTWSGTWLGGFARFCPADTTPPAAPRSFHKAGPHGHVVLAWRADPSAAHYEILRNDRVIAVTTTTTYTPPSPGRYFVRALDVAGNRSATTRAVVI